MSGDHDHGRLTEGGRHAYKPNKEAFEGARHPLSYNKQAFEGARHPLSYNKEAFDCARSALSSHHINHFVGEGQHKSDRSEHTNRVLLPNFQISEGGSCAEKAMSQVSSDVPSARKSLAKEGGKSACENEQAGTLTQILSGLFSLPKYVNEDTAPYMFNPGG